MTEGSKEQYDYDALLNRARDNLPDEIADHDRFKVPEIDSFVEGNTTILRNFSDVASTINREPEKLLKYLLRELGTAGELESGRAVFKGKIGSRKIGEKVNNFVEKYVLCSECGRPDTRLVKEDRITILRCDACGGHRPVTGKKRKVRTVESEEIKEGETYDLLIQDIGKEGDGMAKKGKYTIYVPGTAKGERIKVRINHVTGTLAFGTMVGKGSN